MVLTTKPLVQKGKSTETSASHSITDHAQLIHALECLKTRLDNDSNEIITESISELIRLSEFARSQTHIWNATNYERTRQDLRLTQAEALLHTLAKKLSTLQTRYVDPEDESAFMLAIEAIETILQQNHRQLESIQRLIEPITHIKASTLSESVRRLVIDDKATHLHVKELKAELAAKQAAQQSLRAEIAGLTDKLIAREGATQKLERTIDGQREHVTRLESKNEALRKQTDKLNRHVVNHRIINDEHSQKHAEQSLLIETRDKHLDKAAEQIHAMRKEISEVQTDCAKLESALAIKAQFATSLSTDLHGVTEQNERLKKRIQTRNNWLAGTLTVILAMAGFILSTNTDIVSILQNIG